jgi:HK97 family phage major capsid protein
MGEPVVQTDVRGFMDVLYPLSVYPGLASRGQRLGFGRAGQITIPTWSSTPSIGGSFVAEGAPIPVRQGALTSVSLGPKKLGVITVYTREIATYSNPTIEGLLRSRIQAQTSQAIDSILLDATVASSVRPPGLRAGVAALTATTGGGFNALVGDLKQLLGALVTGSAGNLRAPTWIMNPAQAISIALTQNAGGLFPFQGAIEGGSFYGYPVIQSGSVTAGMVIIVDAADFVSVEGDAPMFTVSAEATLHMEDNAARHRHGGQPGDRRGADALDVPDRLHRAAHDHAAQLVAVAGRHAGVDPGSNLVNIPMSSAGAPHKASCVGGTTGRGGGSAPRRPPVALYPGRAAPKRRSVPALPFRKET